MKQRRLTQDEYDRVLAEQDGGCAICGREPDPKKKLCQDHSHKTGLFRGLLCAYDNRYVVGRHTDPDLMYAVADYLAHPPAERALVMAVYMGKGPTRRKRRKRARRTR